MVERWVKHMRTRGMSESTISAYQRAANTYLGYCTMHDVEPESRKALARYVEELSGRLAPASVHQRYSAIRRYLKWDGHTPPSVELPRMKHRVPRYLEGDGLKRYLAEAAKHKDPMMRTALLLMPMTGMRISEVLSLTKKNIEKRSDGNWLRFIGKGNKEREVPVNDELYRILSEYLRKHFVGSTSSKLFPVSRSTVTRHVARLRERVGAPWLTPHKMRHTFATMFIDGGGNLIALKELLGHESLKTTQIYAHGTKRAKRAGVDGMMPGDTP